MDAQGLLFRFVTGIAFDEKSQWMSRLPASWRRKVSNRILSLPHFASRVRTIPMVEIKALLRLRLGGDMERILGDRNEDFQRRIPQEDIDRCDVVIGFDTSSWILAERARQAGKPFVLDQSIGHPRGKHFLFTQLRERYPDWAEDISVKPAYLLEREDAEYELAQRIVVASTFTKNSLSQFGIGEEKIRINPYGVSDSFFIERNDHSGTRPIRFLCLGTVGARKGSPFLQEVWSDGNFQASGAEVWFAGPATEKVKDLIQPTQGFVYQGRVSHREIPELLGKCDCLLFPSFYEGFGQVILEAMAAGLAVITTENTAGPDIIEHGVDGLLFQAGDAVGLKQLLDRVLTRPEDVKRMGARAREKARTFTWARYGATWNTILQELNRERQ
ncbi:MAG TPA: glycosyltransferase family 4 protein [Cyclobacteriaceae bacterium]|nr:glycosyltransferase family 4 protein [Cyclobacteriaceae bacterium]